MQLATLLLQFLKTNFFQRLEGQQEDSERVWNTECSGWHPDGHGPDQSHRRTWGRSTEWLSFKTFGHEKSFRLFVKVETFWKSFCKKLKIYCESEKILKQSLLQVHVHWKKNDRLFGSAFENRLKFAGIPIPGIGMVETSPVTEWWERLKLG